MNKPETKLQKKMKKALTEKVGGWWIKLHGSPMQKRGLPDLHGTVRGYSIWIEVKMPGKEETELQGKVIRDINRRGKGYAFVSDNVEHAVTTVFEYLNSQQGGVGNGKKEERKRNTQGNHARKKRTEIRGRGFWPIYFG